MLAWTITRQTINENDDDDDDDDVGDQCSMRSDNKLEHLDDYYTVDYYKVVGEPNR